MNLKTRLLDLPFPRALLCLHAVFVLLLLYFIISKETPTDRGFFDSPTSILLGLIAAAAILSLVSVIENETSLTSFFIFTLSVLGLAVSSYFFRLMILLSKTRPDPETFASLVLTFVALGITFLSIMGAIAFFRIRSELSKVKEKKDELEKSVGKVQQTLQATSMNVVASAEMTIAGLALDVSQQVPIRYLPVLKYVVRSVFEESDTSIARLMSSSPNFIRMRLAKALYLFGAAEDVESYEEARDVLVDSLESKIDSANVTFLVYHRLGILERQLQNHRRSLKYLNLLYSEALKRSSASFVHHAMVGAGVTLCALSNSREKYSHSDLEDMINDYVVPILSSVHDEMREGDYLLSSAYSIMLSVYIQDSHNMMAAGYLVKVATRKLPDGDWVVKRRAGDDEFIAKVAKKNFLSLETAEHVHLNLNVNFAYFQAICALAWSDKELASRKIEDAVELAKSFTHLYPRNHIYSEVHERQVPAPMLVQELRQFRQTLKSDDQAPK